MGGGLIHHSDRGGQDSSFAVGQRLLGPGIAAGMGGRGGAYDYALMETFFGTLTIEMVGAAAVADPPGGRGP